MEMRYSSPPLPVDLSLAGPTKNLARDGAAQGTPTVDNNKTAGLSGGLSPDSPDIQDVLALFAKKKKLTVSEALAPVEAPRAFAILGIRFEFDSDKVEDPDSLKTIDEL